MDKKEIVKRRAEEDLISFINLLQPGRVLGSVHKELALWWDREERKSHQLVLLPRDHQKSFMVAARAAQRIVKKPWTRILYISSTSNLAEKQLKSIKDMLTSDIVRFYWPELVNLEEGKREKWTTSEISVDHPLRKLEFIRDPTVFTAGLTTSITGLHCDVNILDDVVVRENAYTEDGRQKVRDQYSLLSAIEGAESEQWVVGTRYHPKDLYADMMSMSVDFLNEQGEPESSEPLYEKFEKVVENVGDGSGEYLWPRQQRYDGQWFGFNQKILAKKRAVYLGTGSMSMFKAQYYNNPNDIEAGGIPVEFFQYYDRNFLKQKDGNWYFQDSRLNVYAAIDFAYSMSDKSDSTAIVVIGVDGAGNYYVMDIDRFKTKSPSEYYNHIFQLYRKWDFRKLRAEVTAAQASIVQGLKENYIYRDGLALSVEENRPNRNQGSKEERITAILEPKYENRQIWHYKGGNCQSLEEELIALHPPHDDIKDALASAIETARPPTSFLKRVNQMTNKLLANPRFGGLG